MALLGQGNFSVRKEAQGVKKIYTRSQLQPITPIGDNPIGWSAVPSAFDAPPNYGNLWSSSATVDPNGVVQGTWSTPTLEEPYTSNPLDRFPFTLGSGDQPPYLIVSGDLSETVRESGLNPYGAMDVVWKAKSPISTTYCGSMDIRGANQIPVIPSKRYRISCWIKRNTWTEGLTYFGIVRYIPIEAYSSGSWSSNTNYYFWSTSPNGSSSQLRSAALKPDQWYLYVGYLYEQNSQDINTDPRAGIHDPTTGSMILKQIGGPVRMGEGITSIGSRIFQYNCPTTFPEVYFWQPRIDLCDGREPSIEQLLKGSPKTPTVTISGETVFKFSSGQTVPENTSITLSAELTNGASSYQWQYIRMSDGVWVNFASPSTSQTYSLAYNTSAFASTNRVQIRCTTVVAGITYTSNVLTISKVYDGIAGSNQAPLFLYKRSSASPANPTNTAVWTFATASYSTAPNNGWETAIPASDGYPCWVIQAVASGNGATDTIAPTDWSVPRLLVQDGSSPATLVLSDSFVPVPVDKTGYSIEDLHSNPKIINAKVYEGTIIATGWTIYWDTTSLGGAFFTNLDASVTDIYEDVSILNVTASKTGFPTLTGKVTFYKMYPPKEGLDAGDAVSINTNVSAQLIRKEKSGLFNPSTILANIKLVSKGQIEIVGVDSRIVYKGRNLARQAYSRYTYLKYGQNAANITVTLSQPDAGVLPSGVSPDRSVRVVTSSASTNAAYVQMRSPVEDLGVTISPEKTYTVSCTVKNIHSTASLIINALIGSSVTLPPGATYTDYGSYLGSLVSTWFSSTIPVANAVGSNPEVDFVIYNIKLEESNVYTGFTFAPEELLLKRDNASYTPNDVYTIPAGTSSIKWDLMTPSGTLLDTETVQVLIDGLDGTSPALLDLTNEATMVTVDYNGNPIGSIETTQANVYEGNILASGWTFTKIDSGCTSSIVGGLVTISAMSADKATVTIKANKTGYSELTAVYSLTKLYPAKDGLPTPVYSLLPAHSSISKSKTGVRTPSTTSCRVKLDVNGQTEIVGDPTKLKYVGRNLRTQYTTATAYSGSVVTFDLADTALVPTEWNAVNARRLISSGGSSTLKVRFLTNIIYPNTEYNSASVYVKNIGTTPLLVRSDLGGYVISVAVGESKRVLMPNIQGDNSKDMEFRFYTSATEDSIDAIVYGFQYENGTYCTPFTFAPEDYKITRNGSAYTSGASTTVTTSDTDVTWALIDPRGVTVDTERIPIVVDGTDGIKGNDGLNNTIVTLYQRSQVSSPDVPPAKPSTGTIVYNFSNLTVSGDLAGWQIDAPTFEAGTKLFKIAASVASYTTTTSIIPLAWVGPVKTEDTEAADLLRGDFTAEIERLDDRIGLEVGGVYTNGLGLVVQQNTAAIQVVDDSVDIKVSAIKVGGSNLFKLTDLEQGTIYANGGLDVALNKVRSKTFIPFTATQITVNAYSAHKPTVIFYNSSYASLGRTYEMDGGTYPTYPRTYDTPTGTTFIKVTVNRSDNSNFLPDQARTEVKVKIEEGNKATSYTESGDDLLTDLSSCGINVSSKVITLTGNTRIVGGSVDTPLLTVDGRIKGNVIDATTINAEDIDASKIKTENLITTNLNVTSGAKMGGFKIDGSRIINDQTDSNGAIYLTKSSENKVIALDVQGALPATSGVYPLVYIKNYDVGLANYGIVLDVNNGGNGSENYAIAIRSGFISGFAAKAKVVSTSSFLITDETFIVYNGTGNTIISLPSGSNAWHGKVVFVRRANTGGVTVSSVAQMFVNGTTPVYSISLGGYAIGMFQFVGGVWYYNAFYQ